MTENEALEALEKLVQETWEEYEETERKIRARTAILGGPAVTPLSDKVADQTAIILTTENIEKLRELPELREKSRKLLAEWSNLMVIRNRARPKE